AISNAPIRNSPANAMNELAHRGLPLGSTLLTVEIFRDHHLGSQQRPGLRHLDIFLLENDIPGVVGDFSGAPLPFDLIEGFELRATEDSLKGQGGPHVGRRVALARARSKGGIPPPTGG